MQEKSHSSPPTSSLPSSLAPLPAAWTDTLNAPQRSIWDRPWSHRHRYAVSLSLDPTVLPPPRMKAPGGWLDSPSSPPCPPNCEEAVIYLRSDNQCTFDAILMFGILPRLSSSGSVKELYAAMTQREASVEGVRRYSQQLSCGGYK